MLIESYMLTTKNESENVPLGGLLDEDDVNVANLATVSPTVES